MKRLERRIKNLYAERKLSVQQVVTVLGVSAAKVNSFLLKHGVKKRNRSEAMRYLNVTKYHKGVFKIKQHLSPREEKLRVAGTMLYWGEGTKFGNSVVLSNSDPEVIRLFLKFLRRICTVSEERLRLLLHCYSDQNERKLKRYWSRITQIPLSQFSKSFLHKKSPGSYKHISKYGTVSLRYSDKRLLSIINTWIEEYTYSL